MLDFDMILLKPFDFLKSEFQAAYTLRQHLNKQPLNGGLAVYRNTTASKTILDCVIDDYRMLPVEQQQWWGDQISVSNLFRKRIGDLSLGEHKFDGERVLLLDAKVYNFTPHDMDVTPQTLSKHFILNQPIDDWMDEPLADKVLLHFKGPRKHLQLQVDWQLRNPGRLYGEHIRHKLIEEFQWLRTNGFARFVETRAADWPLGEIADLGVMSILNASRLWGGAVTSRRLEAEQFLRSIGDFRVKVLTNEKYQTTGL